MNRPDPSVVTKPHRASRSQSATLAGILIFALFARLYRLDQPPQRYFDEVYHAYTAQQWAKGNTDAWDFNAKPPDKGCAYEWTHPPLAKLIMTAGIRIFGDTPWSWRLPAALLGTASVLLIYLVGVSIFRDRWLALSAAGLMSLDALPLFASRIGMNDIYCVTFILAGVYAALNGKSVLSAICIGLAAASKWTTAYALPLIALILLLHRSGAHRRRHLLIAAVSFAVLVPAIYLASYIPYFQAGYSLGDWWQLQQQILGYHTGLKQTHPFASPAWQWPLCGGALWAYTHSDAHTGVIANIWAIGNPVIWWAGVSAVLLSAWRVLRTPDRRTLIPLAGYLAFWAPWLMSPRIMFIYHYLPSLPFLYLLLAGELNRMGKKWTIRYLVAALVVFAVEYPFVTAVQMPAALNIARLFRW